MTQISQKKTALHKIRYKRFGGVKMSFCNTLKPDLAKKLLYGYLKRCLSSAGGGYLQTVSH